LNQNSVKNLIEVKCKVLLKSSFQPVVYARTECKTKISIITGLSFSLNFYLKLAFQWRIARVGPGHCCYRIGPIRFLADGVKGDMNQG